MHYYSVAEEAEAEHRFPHLPTRLQREVEVEEEQFSSDILTYQP
jgi:hypothetical protein